jgi:effector-binding domain-containing protein
MGMVANTVYRLEVRDVPEQIVGSIRGHVPVAELDPWIATAIEELFARLAQQHIRPAGTPFAILPAPNGKESVEVEVALPAVRKVSERGRVEGRVVPGCRALATVHHGPYSELTGAYQALAVAMKENGIEPADEPREIYVNNPRELEPNEYETEVIWPVDVPPDWVPSSPKIERPLPRTRG